MNEIDYHEIGEALVAFLGPEGSAGVLEYREGQGWLLHAAGSLRWDGWHQSAFRNHKSDRLTVEALKSRGIPEPQVPEGGNLPSLMSWQDNFRSEMALSAVPPALVQALQAARSLGRAYVVLEEDFYETALGDGKFLYPKAAFWDADDAGAFAANANPDNNPLGPRRTVKTVRMRVDVDRRVLRADLGVELYEHYSIEDVVRLLAPA